MIRIRLVALGLSVALAAALGVARTAAAQDGAQVRELEAQVRELEVSRDSTSDPALRKLLEQQIENLKQTIAMLGGMEAPRARSSKPGGLPAHIPDPVDPPLVAIDRSETAYTVFLAVAKDASEEQLEQLRSRAAQEEAVELVTWAEFRRTRTKYLDSRIVHDDYPGSKVVEGIIELLRRYASTPFGLTWNGGVALTFNDYEHAKRIYKKYLSDPDEYAATRPKDPRRDPINPKAHFAPLLGWE